MKAMTLNEIISEINIIDEEISVLLKDGGYLNHWEELFSLEMYREKLDRERVIKEAIKEKLKEISHPILTDAKGRMVITDSLYPSMMLNK